MKDWNVVVTVAPGHGHQHALLGALSRLGQFSPSAFKDVVIGRVEDLPALLEAIRQAGDAGADWLGYLGRIIPVEQRFHFTPETLAEQLKQAAAALLDRISGGSFCVRLERRGLAGQIDTPGVERAVADHLYELAEARGIRLRTDFRDPDVVIAAETLGEECGIALLPRDLRTRYPFVAVR